MASGVAATVVLMAAVALVAGQNCTETCVTAHTKRCRETGGPDSLRTGCMIPGFPCVTGCLVNTGSAPETSSSCLPLYTGCYTAIDGLLEAVGTGVRGQAILVGGCVGAILEVVCYNTAAASPDPDCSGGEDSETDPAPVAATTCDVQTVLNPKKPCGNDYYGTGFHLHFVSRSDCKLYGLEDWQAALAVFGGGALLIVICCCCCVCCYRCGKPEQKKERKKRASEPAPHGEPPRRSVRTNSTSSASSLVAHGMILQGGFPVGASSTLSSKRAFEVKHSGQSTGPVDGPVTTLPRQKKTKRRNTNAPKLLESAFPGEPSAAAPNSGSHRTGSSGGTGADRAYNFADERSHFDRFGLDSHLVPVEILRGDLDFAVSGVSALGRGQFGAVKRAWWRVKNGQGKRNNVAVKELTGSPGADAVKEFMFEGALAAQFAHENVSVLHGVVTVGSPTYLVFSYCSKGSLQGCLNGTGRKPLNDTSEAALVTIIKGIAAGMAYLASRSFVHRDLASRNILVNARDIPKIADFGMARTTTDSVYESVNTKMMPLRWAAPEAFGSMVFSEKSDVWAFGVTVIEVFSKAEIPYPQWSDADVVRQVNDGFKIRRPAGCPSDIYKEIVSPCLSFAPEDRPRFSKLFAGTTAIIRKPSYKNWTPSLAEDDDALYEVAADVSPAAGSGNLHEQQGSGALVYTVPPAQQIGAAPDVVPLSDFTYVDMARPATDLNTGANDVFTGFGDESAIDVPATRPGGWRLSSVSDLETVDGVVTGL